MQLNTLLKALKQYQIHGQAALDQVITGLCFDSRQAGPGQLFVAIKGVQTDGHAYLPQVLSAGTTAVVLEKSPDELPQGVVAIQVPSTAEALGLLADAWYEQPSRSLNVIGVTGTNGKTTTATLLYQLFSRLGYPCGLISTVENRIGHKVLASTHTTPDALRLQALLAQMRNEGCEYVFMEVSSHAAHQRRIAGLHFTGAIFSNITHDHLDYHGTFDEYIKAKKLFFDHLPSTAFALTNLDDRRGMVMLQNTKAKCYTYALRQMADFKAKILENSLLGLTLMLDGCAVHTRLSGEFNAYNLLAVYATARLLGVEQAEALRTLSELQAAEGRFDCVHVPSKQIMGVVDYAHTPDALEKVLETLHELRPTAHTRIITVVGCGGDRDKTKRPAMAKIACKGSDVVILSSDNPRSEDPLQILADMLQGVPLSDRHKTQVIAERERAIEQACRLAQPGDLILIAGKGHEKYQEINGEKYPFDDKAMLDQYLAIVNE
jgi:UDP-N-acetylmuramoyl-L-alanyl-D-glutamate--2,6-diaminopimelate ligase